MNISIFAKTISMAALVALACGITRAQSALPSVDVQADAEVKVVPDEVLILFGVETNNLKLNVAKTDNDTVVKKFLAITQDMKIDPKFVQTDFIQIEPVWEQDNDGSNRKHLEYRVRKNVSVTLRDVPKFEVLLSRALEAGVNFVH